VVRFLLEPGYSGEVRATAQRTQYNALERPVRQSRGFRSVVRVGYGVTQACQRAYSVAVVVGGHSHDARGFRAPRAFEQSRTVRLDHVEEPTVHSGPFRGGAGRIPQKPGGDQFGDYFRSRAVVW
jgi:hypothetical protein